MMKIFRFALLLFSAIVALSWGKTGHRTVGLIAERHLSDKAKAGVKELLGTTTLADVSTWADEVRGQDAYKQTGPWHYLNLPLGLSRDAFDETVNGMTTPNVYSAYAEAGQTLYNPSAPKEERIKALKFLVHFVGDLHQPMHVSRSEDQGGNKVQVNFEGQGTNLHALWDSKLLDKEGLSDQGLAEKIDHPDSSVVKQWQSDGLLTWLWESYQISSTLYKEVDAMSSRSIGEEYYKSHIGIAEERLDKAGVRLAGVLNLIFSGGSMDGRILPPPPEMGEAPQEKKPAGSSSGAKQEGQTISLQEVARYTGKQVRVCGKVFGDKAFSGLVLVNLGAAYPAQLLTVVLKGEAKENWKTSDGKTLCVIGKVGEYKGKPQIELSKPTDFTIQ